MKYKFFSFFCAKAGDGIWTHNTWNGNPVLCQLSYTREIGADNGIRTHDPKHGKLVL